MPSPKKNILAFLLLVLAGKVLASLPDTAADSTRMAWSHLYRYNFQQATAISSKLKKNYPESYEVYLLEANVYWWYIITGEDTNENRELYEKAVLSAIAILKKLKKEYRPEELYAMLSCYGAKSRIEAFHKNYLKAISNLNTAIDYLQLSFKRENELEWFQLTSGLYNYHVEKSKKSYPVFLPYLVFLPKGNMEKGLQQLERAFASGDEFLSSEAAYFLMKIYLEFEHDFPVALKHASALCQRYPENLLYRYHMIRSLIETEKIEEAKAHLALLMRSSEKNTQLTPNQKHHFINIAREDFKKYFLTLKK